MGGLFLTRGDAAPARAAYARQGFGEPTELALPGWRALHWPYIAGGPELLLIDGEDFAAVSGTITVDGRTGRPALRALLDAVDERGPDRGRIGGHFAALVHRHGRARLFCDPLAAYQLFHDGEDALFSTSMLAAAESLPRVSFDQQGVYEFAFNVTALGDDTLFRELKLLGPGVIVELTLDHAVRRSAPVPLSGTEAAQPLSERIERHRAALDGVLRAHLDGGTQVRCPLSGGLDSRLLLASLRATGAEPDVYVYGPPRSRDVNIARGIGEALGFPVAWTDKGRDPVDPDAFPEVVARNFHAFDGAPTFGAIFDNGGHRRAWRARHAGGLPAASGGAGEVFRDFFYLPDRPFTAEAVARAFYARFTPRDATELFDPCAFIDRIAAKMQDALGRPHDCGPLPRLLVEQLYPRFRCRALFGRELSLESRLGPYLLPFLEQPVLAEAASLPAPLRRAGRFEAALLHAIDPALAEQPSAYGHHFAGPPSLRHRFAEARTRARPVWLRERSYALQRRLGPMSDEHGGLLDPGHLGRVIDLDYPAMRRFFRPERITDSGLLRRVACMEYLAQHLGSRLISA